MKLIMIARDPDLAQYVVEHGVQRIMVDLEVLGKAERQGHLDTVFSHHTWEDVDAVRQAVPHAEVMVRINPYHEGSAEEIQCAVDAGADLVMVPMVADAETVDAFSHFANGRVGLVPLVETAAGACRVQSIAATPGVHEVYFGLNDMHLQMGLSFMFELLAGGMVDAMATAAGQVPKRFGFGGIGRMAGDRLPGRSVLGEHVRLGSESVILARSFHARSQNLAELKERVDFVGEVRALRQAQQELEARTPQETELDRHATAQCIHAIAAQIRQGGS